MPRYVAFLRAINVGGHIVKMDRLRQLFEELKLLNVSTFIASGNVLFDATARSLAALERRIEQHLEQELGYSVATLIRPLSALQSIAESHPFGDSDHTIHIGFLKEAPRAEYVAKVMALQTPMDVFHTHEGQLYWLSKQPFNLTKITNRILERALGDSPVTFRNINTVRRLAAMAVGTRS